jgi:hypothetical protein
MQGYSKGSIGHFITEHYEGLVEAFMQCYSKGTMGPFITVHYNG